MPVKRRPATTPRKRIGRDSGALSLSPPALRTPPKTACRHGAGPSSQYAGDRFIPNRSALRVDMCRASVESVEKNLGRTFERLSRREHQRRMRSAGENGDPNSMSSSSSSSNGNGGGGGTASPPPGRDLRRRRRSRRSRRPSAPTEPRRPSRPSSTAG